MTVGESCTTRSPTSSASPQSHVSAPYSRSHCATRSPASSPESAAASMLHPLLRTKSPAIASPNGCKDIASSSCRLHPSRVDPGNAALHRRATHCPTTNCSSQKGRSKRSTSWLNSSSAVRMATACSCDVMASAPLASSHSASAWVDTQVHTWLGLNVQGSGFTLAPAMTGASKHTSVAPLAAPPASEARVRPGLEESRARNCTRSDPTTVTPSNGIKAAPPWTSADRVYSGTREARAASSPSVSRWSLSRPSAPKACPSSELASPRTHSAGTEASCVAKMTASNSSTAPV